MKREEVLASYNVLDTAPEPEFDDIVGIAQRVCRTKTALVSLVDIDRQWFKARVGFPVCETSLDRSVCAHALEVDDLLVIPDLSIDPRTRTNPLVTGEPRIRFYAGAVLRSPQGAAFGSLCVIDDAVRLDGLTPDQAETLKALARQTMALLSFRRAIVSHERVSAQLAADGDRQMRAQEVGGIGTFEVDVRSDEIAASAEFRRIFGLPEAPALTVAGVQALTAAPGEARHTTVAMRQDGLAPREVEYRIRRADDGALRWILRRTGFRTGADGAVEQMIGTVQDVTDRKLADGRMQALVASGDALRDVTSVADAVAAVVRLAGEALAASRVGYVEVDRVRNTLKVERDWTAPGQTSVAGIHPAEGFGGVLDRLEQGSPLIVANQTAASWLGADASHGLLLGATAMMVVPLARGGRLAGLFFVHAAEPRTWTRDETDFAVTFAERTYAAIARIEAEEQQRVLNEELSHRLKNTLSMVQSMIGQTLRPVAERGLVRALEERILALSKAHDILLQQSWKVAPLAAVVEQAQDLHGSGRFTFVGPNILLGAKATLSLSLLLHELATNATKYGALSVPEGRVAVAWHLGGEDEATLVLQWTERGGPPAAAPARRGFGSRLISMGLAGSGLAALDYAPQGFSAKFEAPLQIMTEP